MLFTGLILNLALLVALSVVSGFVEARWHSVTRLGRLLQGVVFGGAAVIGMLNPVVIVPGLIFDGRSVVISLAGLFFGPWAAATAALMAIPVRIGQAGPGLKMGLLVIITSALLGALFHKRKTKHREIASRELLGFGLLVHLVMLAMTPALPAAMILPTLQRIGWPALVAYPLATVLIGKILSDQAARGEFLASLQESENRYRCLFENSRDAVMTLEPPSWKFTSGNPATLTMFRVQDEAQFLTLTPWDISPERQPDGQLSAEWAKSMATRALNEGSHFFEWTHRRITGETFPGTVLLSRVQVAGKVFLQATIRDITEQKRVEAARLKSLEQYRRAILAAGAVPYEKQYGVEGYLFMGENIRELTGYAADEMGSATWREIVLESVMMGEAAGLTREEAIARVRAGQLKHWRVDHLIRARGGQLRWISDSSIQIYEADGRPSGSIGIIQDMTQRKELEAQLRQAQKMDAIGQLAGGVAHDFNNILAVMMLQLGLMRASSDLLPATRESIGELEVAAQRAAALVRQLLLFGRRSVMQTELLNLNEVVANVLKMLRRLIGEHIELTFHPCASLPLIEADAGMLEQVLMNLTVNARDAMPRGGPIQISTALRSFEPDQAQTSLTRRPGQFVCLSVRDHGCGMDENTLKHIFEPFFTTKETGKGTGLGLATVHGIVSQHKGWVEVQSQVGKGSQFDVFLPASEAKSPAVLPSVSENARAVQKSAASETILLVEDEERVRRVAARLLGALGYAVLEAANGVEAQALWHNAPRPIDLLFTDMIMPGGLSGLDLAERFQAEKPGLKVIISSGYNQETTQSSRGSKPGISYLPKPYPPAKLAEVVRHCLDT